MKFLCNTEFVHSGVRLYYSGTVYSDITPKEAEELIALDKSKPLGALSFFTPVDEDAVNFIKGKGKQPASTPGTAGKTDAPKPPTKAELIETAKKLGITGADRMKEDELKQVIEAVKSDTNLSQA